METSYKWDFLSESSTRMTLRNRGEPTGFSRLAAPFHDIGHEACQQE